MKLQRGLTLNGMLFGSAIFALVALLAMKVLPEWIEYGKVVKAIKATATDPTLKDATVSQVKASFARRADIDELRGVSPDDLDISKEAGELIISVSYVRKVPLFGNASLVFDFEASSAKQ
jgi:hypothetical protein